MQDIDLTHHRAYLYHSPWASGGISIGDLDGNGLPDIFLGGAARENALFLQEAPWQFRALEDPGKLAGRDHWAGGSAMVDIDGDSDLDLLVCYYDSPLQVFINDGSGKKFTEAASQMGLAITDASLMPFFADYDSDGDLDLYLLTNRYEDPAGKPANPPVETINGVTRIKPEFQKYYFLKRTGPTQLEADVTGRPDYLFRNDGPGDDGLPRFSNVTKEAGLDAPGHGLAAIWWDFNLDGLPDLFVANDFNDPDHLYENQGDGTFRDVAEDHLPQTAWFSMGADVGDMNNDGLLDLFTTDMAATTHYKAKISMGNMQDWLWGLENFWPRQAMRNNFFLNTGSNRFMEIAPMAGLSATDWTWGVRMADLDNDSRLDLFFTNGAARYFNNADMPVSTSDQVGKTSWDHFANGKPLKEENLAFRNEGNLSFSNQSKAWGLNENGVSMAAAQSDLDGDGDLDLIVSNLGSPVSVLQNHATGNHALKVTLRGKSPNTSALGAQVEITTPTNGRQVRILNPYSGFLASSDHAIHFGLGSDTLVSTLSIRWPNGSTETFTDLQGDRELIFAEPEAAKPIIPIPPKAPLFKVISNQSGLDFKHTERLFDDFQLQPLLPGKLSQLGPGLAMGDADGDGDDDLFLCGAAGQSGALYLVDQKGHFTKATGNFAWERHAESEGMGAVWFDVDSDGDLDLFVSHGTPEFPERSINQQNRIYLNNSSNGRLIFAETELLAIPIYGGSNGTVAVHDYDLDGDPDLLIGGRTVPGKFPTTPASYLLRNDSTQEKISFSDVTADVIPALQKCGMVTSALWSDANGDGQTDLLVTTEWGPVRLFLCQDQKFQDATEFAGFAERTGWWNSITSADFDLDGDLDYAVMNVGLNTKYGHPTPKAPSLLYYGDVDGSGVERLIEAKPDKSSQLVGVFLPVRGKSCSSAAIPSLNKKFPTFDSFAKSKLDEIYAPDRLASAQRFAANNFESGLLINDGSGKFSWQALPRLAQAAPSYGVVTGDFNGDGYPDLCAAQNLYSREPETGLWRGGVGLFLAGTGNPDQLLDFIPAGQSGFVIDGDGKALVLTDLNNDGSPDFIASENNDFPVVIKTRPGKEHGTFVVRLQGPKGNPQGIGATIRVSYDQGRTATSEIHGGSGYLSHSSPVAFFASQGAREVTVTWPDQTKTTVPYENSKVIKINHP
ncbi:FG-GAP-like repeat-containing protein [Verrucomicrobiaceae bacterium 227]